MNDVEFSRIFRNIKYSPTLTLNTETNTVTASLFEMDKQLFTHNKFMSILGILATIETDLMLKLDMNNIVTSTTAYIDPETRCTVMHKNLLASISKLEKQMNTTIVSVVFQGLRKGLVTERGDK